MFKKFLKIISRFTFGSRITFQIPKNLKFQPFFPLPMTFILSLFILKVEAYISFSCVYNPSSSNPPCPNCTYKSTEKNYHCKGFSEAFRGNKNCHKTELFLFPNPQLLKLQLHNNKKSL